MASPFASATSLNDYRNLLEAGFDPNEASLGDGTTAVFHLWDVGTDVDYAALLELLVQYGMDLDRLDSSGNTALFRSECDALSLSLVRAGASISTDRPENFQTRSVLVSSVKKGHVDTIKHMVETLGVSPDTYLGRGTALHHVLYNPLLLEGDLTRGLASLVTYAGEVDARDFMGKTPLFLVYESAECATVLLDGGADPNLKIPRGWWFHRYVFNASSSGELGADFVDGPMLRGRSWERAIHGVHYRCPEVTRVLLERGADIDSVDSDGNTALHRLLSDGALTRHAFEVFNILYSFGASCTIRNVEGKTVCDLLMCKHPLVSQRVQDRVKDENWRRRRGFFLVLARCRRVSGESGWETEGGVLKILAGRGYEASRDFMATIVEYI